MKNKNKWFLLFLTMLCVFMLGSYTEATIHDTRTIELYQWVLMSFFGIFFLITFKREINEKTK